MSEEKFLTPIEICQNYNLKYDLVLRNIRSGKIKSTPQRNYREARYLIKESDFLKWLDYYYFSKGIENENK